MKKYSIRYRNANIKLLTNPRKGICEVCGYKGLTNCHHWKYEFSTQQVRENPELALKNVVELCYIHHKIANALKLLIMFSSNENNDKILKVLLGQGKAVIRKLEVK